MLETERMAEFMQASQVNDRITEKRIFPSAPADRWTQGVGIRANVHSRPAAAIDDRPTTTEAPQWPDRGGRPAVTDYD